MKARTSCEFMLSIMYLGLLGGAERGSRGSQIPLNPICGRVRAAEHAPRGRFDLLERRHGLTEIVERSVGVLRTSSRWAWAVPARPCALF